MSGSKMKHVNVHSKDSSKPKLRWVFLNLKKSASVKPLQSLPICAGQEMFLLKYLFGTSGHSHYTFFSEFLALALPTRCLQPNSTLHRSVQKICFFLLHQTVRIYWSIATQILPNANKLPFYESKRQDFGQLFSKDAIHPSISISQTLHLGL